MPKPEISVQLYSIHQALDADLDGSLRRLADIGLRTVEAFDFVRRADALEGILRPYGLTAPTGHAILIEDGGRGYAGRSADGAAGRGDLRRRRQLGVEVVIDPFVAPDRWTTLEDVQRNAERLNARAAQAEEFGLRRLPQP